MSELPHAPNQKSNTADGSMAAMVLLKANRVIVTRGYGKTKLKARKLKDGLRTNIEMVLRMETSRHI